MRCSPQALGDLPPQPSILPLSRSSFMRNSSHNTGGGEFPCMNCIKMALHIAVLPQVRRGNNSAFRVWLAGSFLFQGPEQLQKLDLYD